jgi:magnesium chelatase subunit I
LSEDIQNIVEQSFNSSPKYTEIKAGFPEDYSDIKTIRDLLAINYKLVGAKEQLRSSY